ncbi:MULTISPECIES: GNAT family N-acetyltransferase [unclassified Microbacterium]|uniref:GNAT family N-acetyltransferase n=1 Tax=unclassified Microbacterium TaxID=2609290 RepID=UPI0030173CF2
MTGPVVRLARAEDEPALTALWATAFTPALAPDQWLVDTDRLAHTIVAADAAGVCGSIYGLPTRLRESDGGIAEVHAIGSVAVAERSRGQGLARQLVAATLEAGRDADWALLFTGTPEVYRSSGFETFSMPRTLSGPWRPPASTGAGGAVVRETVGAGSLGPLGEVYARSRDGRVVLAPVRGERAWAMAEVRLGGATLYRSEADPTVRGYAIAESRDRVGTLLEIAVLPDAPDAAEVRRALLAAVAADWASAGVTSCDLAIPALPEDELAARAFAPEVVRHDDRTGMIRPLRREARLHGIRHFTAGDYF